MKELPPRLRNLLTILATDPDPQGVGQVADKLRVSKRTVFRELAKAGTVLEPYGLEVGSKPGEGVRIEGPPQARDKLLDDLDTLEEANPADKRERQDRLVVAVLANPGQKLATYADKVKASAPTISHDLTEVEPRLAERGLQVQRRAGTGLAIHGDEMGIRRLVIALLFRARENGSTLPYPHPDILLDIHDLDNELDPLLGWMTPHSRDALYAYLAVMVQRVMDGHTVGPAEPVEDNRETAHTLATIVEEAFNITLPEGERAWLSIEIAGCRPAGAGPKRSEADMPLEALAAEMIDRFDPARAAVLKLDELLVDGLVTHMRTALVRIRHGIELRDPMREQIVTTYPDVMGRSRRACSVLKRYGETISDDEVSLIAAHFGASLLRLGEKGLRQQTVRVGVICVHGIGSSYLLASRVRREFGSRLLAEVSWHDDRENWRNYDILVSATPLPEADMPVVVVSPMLDKADVERIEAVLAAQTGERENNEPGPGFVDNLATLALLADAAKGLVEGFRVEKIRGDIEFRELAAVAGRVFCHGDEEARDITAALLNREAIASQVVPELGVVLLHCRTASVARPLFGCIQPDGGAFSRPNFTGAAMAVVLIAPSTSPREIAEMMGAISSALIERPKFLVSVRAGDASAIRAGIEGLLGEFLFQFSLQKLKG
ncbi:MAG: transcription antiterminator [Planctomycetaceae bacterium]|nr:transcription antiterminator [Planctomycetaceae bacterium]